MSKEKHISEAENELLWARELATVILMLTEHLPTSSDIGAQFSAVAHSLQVRIETARKHCEAAA